MTSKILIAAHEKARRLSHKESLEKIRPNSEFTLVKSFQQILEAIEKDKFSLIVLDSNVDDIGKNRKREEAIMELKAKSKNIPITMIGYEINDAIESLKDGVDGFIPVHWLSV